MWFRCEQNYGTMGLDLTDSGGQGGDLNSSREALEGSLKHWLGWENDSFGLLLVCLGGLNLWEATLHNATAFSLLCKVKLYHGLHNVMVWFDFVCSFHTSHGVCVDFVGT